MARTALTARLWLGLVAALGARRLRAQRNTWAAAHGDRGLRARAATTARAARTRRGPTIGLKARAARAATRTRAPRTTPATWILLGPLWGLGGPSLRAQTSDEQIANRVFDSTHLALKVNVVATGGGGGAAPDFPNLTQLLNRAYDSTNAALKVNCVAGCGGSTGIGGTLSGGTPGSVLFVGAGPALAQDNANFFWDATNHRLGIGTASPAYPLDLASGAARSANFSNTGASGAGVYSVASGATSPIAIYGAVTGTNPSNGIAVYGQVNSSTGNTAVGVRGDCSNTNTTCYGLYGLASSASTTNIGAYFSSAGGTSNYALITGSGNVGIGTGTPASALSVNGGFSTAQNTVAFSATPAFDASKGNLQSITLSGNVTSSTLSNAVAGQYLDFEVCQDATGGRLFTWPGNVKGGGPVPAAASACLNQRFVFDGSNANASAPPAPLDASSTAQTAAISAVTLSTPQAAGTYLVSLFVHCTTSDASGKTVTGSLNWTDGGVALSKSTSAVAVASTGNFDQVTAAIHADANTAITYSTTTSGAFTSAQYRADARLSM